MKKVFLICILLGGFSASFSQQGHDIKTGCYSIGAQYNHEFVLGGFVRVREWDLEGDKMNLKDLGMTSYSAIQFHAEKHLRKNRSFSIVYDNYFIRGHAIFDRDITYNGTIINGRKGIDVSPTRYFRISAVYAGVLFERPHLLLRYKASLVFDHITFYLDGEVTPSSPKTEVLEGFGRQAFPYPVLGLQGKVNLGHDNKINFEVSGTYVPKFKSFYTEGGNVDLQYDNVESSLSYSKVIADFEMALGTKFRYMHLFQESKEDTNIISTVTAGPFVALVYRF